MHFAAVMDVRESSPTPDCSALGAAQAARKRPQGVQRDVVDLVVISFGLLFLEQACIRWVPAHVRLLGYFANTVLLAAFLGMGLGLLCTRRRSVLPFTLPLLLAIVLLLSWLKINVKLEPESFGQSLYFGAEIVQQTGADVPFAIILGTSYVVLALLFTGPGQAMGQLFDRLPPLRAYSWNVGGSILGILVFMGVSALSLSPVWWFALSGLCIAWLLRGRRLPLLTALASLLLVVGLVAGMERDAIWSPYNRISLMYDELNNVTLLANNMSHQVMVPNNSIKTLVYELPYLIAADAGRPLQVGRTMVIGAGSGNDVSHMLLHGAAYVDAVEIDPRIRDIGRAMHPNQPYSDPRVHSTIDDGRSFLRRTDARYDLIVYALVDSLSLMSQFSSVRLENYLFTRQAFELVRDRLKPHGVFVAYNYYREAWLAARIYRMLEAVFGAGNVTMLTMPPRKSLSEDDTGVDLVIFMAGDVAKVRDVLLHGKLLLKMPHGASLPLQCVRDVSTHDLPLTSDDWPFPYLRYPGIPAQNLQGISIVIVIAIVMIFGPGRVRPRRVSIHFFCLGAAFMMVETEGIARLALLFGTTWINNSLAFLGILSLALLANLVAAHRDCSPRAVYAALFVALFLEYAVPLGSMLVLPPAIRSAAALLLLFLPVFFAGLVFAFSFRESEVPHDDLGSNVLGAVAGGCLENLSGLMGFRGLLLVIAAFYFLSMLARGRVATR